MNAQATAVDVSPNGRHAGRLQKLRVPDLCDVLRERIARQEIAPGTRLRENELASEFRVPRTVVREAFSALEQRRLIERIPRHGAIVARLDFDQALHIYAVREVLEGLCVRLATMNSRGEDWQDLVNLFDGPIPQCVAKGDVGQYLAADKTFRRRMISASGNQNLAQLLDSLWDRTEVVIRRVILMPGRMELGLAEHQAVLHAMRRSDAISAEQLRRANMRSAKETFMKFRSYLL